MHDTTQGVHDQAAIVAKLVRRIAALERAASQGIVLRSPDGTRWRVTVDDAGVLDAPAI